MKNKFSLLVLVSLLAIGCVGAPEESSISSASTGPATVTTDASSYHYAVDVAVTWSGLNGNAKDWVALAPAGSDLTVVTKWAYTGGATAGTMTLEGPAPGGDFVARAFDNDTYTLMGESDPFHVANASDTTGVVTLDQTSYAIDQDVVVTWSGMPGGDPKDWIGLFPQAADDHYAAVWLYTGGATSGNLTFHRGVALTGYTGGNYDARIFLNDTYTKVGQSGDVLMGSLVTTNASSYTTNQAITVSWTHLPGTAGDWVALAPQGSLPDVVTVWMYTGGAVNGSQTFAAGLSSAGTYVARTMVPDQYVISGESAPFTVAGGAPVTVTTDQASYNQGDQIVVTWSGLPGNQHDWIAIAPSGSTDTTVTSWIYTNGQASGSATFQTPATGSYVARAFLNDAYLRVGESASFVVN